MRSVRSTRSRMLSRVWSGSPLPTDNGNALIPGSLLGLETGLQGRKNQGCRTGLPGNPGQHISAQCSHQCYPHGGQTRALGRFYLLISKEKEMAKSEITHSSKLALPTDVLQCLKLDRSHLPPPPALPLCPASTTPPMQPSYFHYPHTSNASFP